MTEGLGTKTIVQVGLVVRDIETSIDNYVRIFGLTERPQARETETPDVTNIQYRGETTQGRAKLAFINMGQVTIELIEPIGGPSTWQEFLDAHGEGVHHIAFNVKGTPQVVSFLNGQGIPVVQRGDYTGGMYTYLDAAPKLGVILELLENF